MIFRLRPYQQKAEDDVRAVLRSGKRRPLLVMPCAAGKTVTFCSIIRQSVAKGRRVLVLAHTREIISQTSAKLDAYGVPHGVIMGDHWRNYPELPVQVASTQTIARRTPPPADFIVLDECHHARSNTLWEIFKHYPDVPVLGTTATPWRNDGKGLDSVFDSVVVATTTKQLIEQGYLAPYGGFSFDAPDLRGVRKRGFDYDEKDLGLACNKAKIVGGIVEQWLAHAENQRTIVFAVGIEHSKSIVERFKKAGIAAEHLDGTTGKTERAAILDRLSSGVTRVVSNVNVLSEGWDCPAASCCILARPTTSLVLYLQQVGRVLRMSHGKARATIHDHAGLLLKMGLPDEDRDYSLTSDVSVDDRAGVSIVQCPPPCGRIYPATQPTCPECGAQNPHMTPQARDTAEREVEEVEAIRKLAIDEIRQMRAVSIKTKAAEYKRLLLQAKMRGYHWKWANHRYRDTFGTEPFPELTESALASVIPATHPVLDMRRLKDAQARVAPAGGVTVSIGAFKARLA